MTQLLTQFIASIEALTRALDREDVTAVVCDVDAQTLHLFSSERPVVVEESSDAILELAGLIPQEGLGWKSWRVDRLGSSHVVMFERLSKIEATRGDKAEDLQSRIDSELGGHLLTSDPMLSQAALAWVAQQTKKIHPKALIVQISDFPPGVDGVVHLLPEQASQQDAARRFARLCQRADSILWDSPSTTDQTWIRDLSNATIWTSGPDVIDSIWLANINRDDTTLIVEPSSPTSLALTSTDEPPVPDEAASSSDLLANYEDGDIRATMEAPESEFRKALEDFDSIHHRVTSEGEVATPFEPSAVPPEEEEEEDEEQQEEEALQDEAKEQEEPEQEPQEDSSDEAVQDEEEDPKEEPVELVLPKPPVEEEDLPQDEDNVDAQIEVDDTPEAEIQGLRETSSSTKPEIQFVLDSGEFDAFDSEDELENSVVLDEELEDFINMAHNNEDPPTVVAPGEDVTREAPDDMKILPEDTVDELTLSQEMQAILNETSQMSIVDVFDEISSASTTEHDSQIPQIPPNNDMDRTPTANVEGEEISEALANFEMLEEEDELPEVSVEPLHGGFNAYTPSRVDIEPPAMPEALQAPTVDEPTQMVSRDDFAKSFDTNNPPKLAWGADEQTAQRSMAEIHPHIASMIQKEESPIASEPSESEGSKLSVLSKRLKALRERRQQLSGEHRAINPQDDK